ncbi:MAG: hypothetical protein PHD57_01440 [Desulfobacterales bacterium]|jgi:DNA repair exonuclease SbcCD nuclease subunit|nr:hypothetical protein [Desulfobacterales bacterium]MDD3081419.1 hypothetical protein [Desulfobacterales bacterium]MDD3950734.1 hypothetical protein [Desulfobacterales bacterium]MDD4463868.1 hypothetical protein [Desulfobacterales bacterium]
MAAFDPSKDKVLKSWRSEDTGLIISINQYGEGQPKVQIGPRIILRKDGKETQVRSGRLSMEDLMWFYDIIDEVRDALTELTQPC